MNYPFSIKTIFFFLTVLLSCTLCKAQIFVNSVAKGSNDGSSWENAYTNLQDALDEAQEGDQIWVASGTYLPGKSGDPKPTTFHLTKGAKIYGGFAGTESNLTERNIIDHPTILSGDLNQDDIADNFEVNRTDNVWTVMLIENQTTTVPVIDGFTFIGGHADGEYELYEESCGGGLFLYGPTFVRNCSFAQNYSSRRAGALFLVDSLGKNTDLEKDQIGLIVEGCQFNNNYSKAGGAVNIRLVSGKVSSVVIRNSNFSNNTCEKYGGGLCVVTGSDNVSVKVDSCNFSNNVSSTNSGAISFQFHEGKRGAFILQNSTFSENSSKEKGGAISVRSGASGSGTDNRFEINNCQFKGNLSNIGGAIYSAIYASNIKAIITKCGFSENQGRRLGGAIYSRTFQKNINNHFEVSDCSFKKNFTSVTSGSLIGGGAIYLYAPGISNFATLSRSQFIENSTNGWGGAIAMVTGEHAENNNIEIDSCLLQNNSADCGGGILYMSKGLKDSLSIRRSDFIGNRIEDVYPGFATTGGAIHLDYVFTSRKGYSRIEDCLFENNLNAGGDGGALAITPTGQASFSRIYNCEFKGNETSGKGGGFLFSGIDGNYELEGCTFENNKAAGNGGAHFYELPHFDKSLFYIFFHGVLWVQILYSLLLFLISRERTTLYYTLLMIGISLFWLVIIDFDKIYFFNSLTLPTRLLLIHTSAALGITGLVKFAQHYLNVNQIIPFFKKAVSYFFIVYFTLFLVRISLIQFGLDEYKAITVIMQFLTFLGVTTPVFWALFVLKKGYKPAKYFLLAMLFIGLAIILLLISFIQIGHFLNAPITTIQSLILMTVITLGLVDGYRVNLLKKDKVRAERLTELDIAKTRLYTNITHEFRTPLTVIMGASDMVRGNESEKKLIQRNSKQLLALINKMLDLSKLEGGSLKLEPQQGDIIPFIEYLVESFQSLADSKYIKLTFYRELEELVMDYDADKVQAVITNLLSNAIKFTAESGKVVVHAKKEEVKGKPQLILVVRDNGAGIPAADIPHVFDRFFQVDASDMHRSEGSGIGLALVKELVQLMKGKIDVSSKLGEGTVFTLRIPITNDAPFQADIVPRVGLQSDFESPIEEEDSPLFQPLADDVPMVLVIEDNKDVVRFLRSCLQRKYKIEVAYNGQQGIDKALDIVPDIIISDVMMPEADGYTVCKTLKADERTSHVPIIMLTAKATQDDKVLGLDAGADAYLNKPFHRQELEVRLQKLIEGRQQLQQHYQSLLHAPPGSVKPVDPFIQKLRNVIEENIESESFSISKLCQAVNLSRMQVHRKLTALTGMPASQFIHSIRLQKGYQLLQETDLNVSEVAYRVGFPDPSYFTRLFVKNYGTTPSEISKKS